MLTLRSFLGLFAVLALNLALCAQDADGVYTKVDENPAPIKTAKPEYPLDLKRDGVSGLAAVSCVIDETGNVISCKVTKSSNPGFEKPALDAIAKWKFKPAKKDGKEVKVKVTIPFRFNLDE